MTSKTWVSNSINFRHYLNFKRYRHGQYEMLLYLCIIRIGKYLLSLFSISALAQQSCINIAYGPSLACINIAFSPSLLSIWICILENSDNHQKPLLNFSIEAWNLSKQNQDLRKHQHHILAIFWNLWRCLNKKSWFIEANQRLCILCFTRHKK